MPKLKFMPMLLVAAGAPLPLLASTDSVQTDPVLKEVAVEAVAAKSGSAASGYRSDSASAGPLGKVSRQNVPFTISTTSAELIENLQAGNATDALRYDPTVNPEMGSNRTGDYFAIRGFVNSTNQAIDGMRSEMCYGILEDKESVEVLSGAASLLYGIASPAGIVNYVLKRPTEERFLQLKVGDYGGSQLYAHVDAGGPIGQSFGYRVNLLGVNDGNTAIDKEKNPRNLASLAFDWHPSSWVTWSIDASRYYSDYSYMQAFFKLNKATVVPDAPDASVNYASPYSSNLRTYTDVGTSISADPASWISLRGALRFGCQVSKFASMRNLWVDNAGNYTQQMMYYKSPEQTDVVQGNAFVDIKGVTGLAEHKLTLGCLADRSEVDWAGSSTKKWTVVYAMDDPGYSPDPELDRSQDSYLNQRTLRRTGIAVDQVFLGRYFKAMGGVAYASIMDEQFNADGSTNSYYHKGALTPGFALSYLPTPKVTFYASYVQALEEGDVADADAANAGKQLDPYLSSQVEVGVKTNFGGFAVDAAVFRIEKANSYDEYSADSSSYVVTENGREVHIGAQLSFSGKVLPCLTIFGGASFLDAEITKTDDASVKGKSPQAVPDALARLFAEYSPPWVGGLFLNGGVSYTGKEWVNDANTVSIPSVVTADAGIRYTRNVLGKDLTARVSVSNLTGENYWTTKGGSMLYLGSPRTVAGSLAVKF